MARPPSSQPTEGELEILRVLWDQGSSTLGMVRGALGRPVASTTVATMLKVMLEKRLVRRRKGKRGYEWTAASAREHTASGMLHRLIDRVFEGSARGAVVQLIEDGQLSGEDRQVIRRLLDEREERSR